MLNLYEKLQASPLFSGLTNDNIYQIIGQTKFCFNKYTNGQTIKQEGDPCNCLTFLINGQACAISYGNDYGYSVEENIAPPYIFQPERLFGLTQRYSKTFICKTTCDTVGINKNDILQLSDEFFIFKLNIINIISAMSQKAESVTWHPLSYYRNSLLIRFFSQHLTKPYGEKVFRIKMTRLAAECGMSRLAVSSELNRLQEQGLLTFSRGIITIPSFEKLLGK